MMSHSHHKAGIGIFLGLALVAAASILAVRHWVPNGTFGLLFLSGIIIYLWGCAALARAKGYTAGQGIFLGIACPPALLLFIFVDRTRMSREEREKEDRDDAVEETARRSARRRPLRGPKKAVAWLLGLFLLTLGAAIIFGYEIYWERVVVPERNRLATAISINSEKLDPQNDGKLVHVTGLLAGAETLADPDFGVTVDALRLRRRVWMYQWQQGGVQSQSSFGTEDSRGNSTTLLKTKTYHYSQGWYEAVINSSGFYNAGHDNPTAKRIPDRAVAAAHITLGPFSVAPELVEQIDNFQPVPVSGKNLSAIAEALRAQAKLMDDGIYFGANADQPAIGDLKVKFESAPPATASIIARQSEQSLSPCPVAGAGSVSLLRMGTYSVPEMTAQFAKTNSQQRMIAWVAGGIIILFGGLLIKIAAKR